MECPICGAELEHVDSYGFLAAHQSGVVLGEIYRCPNHEGFSSFEEAEQYIFDNKIDMDEYGFETWMVVVCDSSCNSVSGYFYTSYNELREGYPC